MHSKPHHHRHHRYSERNQVIILAGIVLVLVLGLMGLFLWFTNKP